MLSLRNPSPAVVRFRRVVTLSLLVRVVVLMVAGFLILNYLGGT